MEDIMGLVKSLEESGLLIKGAHETIGNEAKEPKGESHDIFIGTLGVSLLGNLLVGKNLPVYMCVCMYVFLSIHCEGFISLKQLQCQGTDELN